MCEWNIYIVWTAYADTGLGNRDRLSHVHCEVTTAVLKPYSRKKLGDVFVWKKLNYMWSVLGNRSNFMREMRERGIVNWGGN